MVRHLSMFDFVALSGTQQDRAIEYIDHLHEHFLDPVVIIKRRYVLPTMPGYSTRCSSTIGDYSTPRSSAWNARPGGIRMKAGPISVKERCVVRDVPHVEPEADEVQIDVAYTGLCGTDLHIFHGDMDARVSLPAIIGHEMSGTIRTVGDEVSGWHSGDTVTVMPLEWCGACPACLAGYSHVCERLKFVGIDSPGSLQDRWNIPASLLVRVPPALSLRDAALAEPTAVAVHDVRRASLAPGEKAS